MKFTAFALSLVIFSTLASVTSAFVSPAISRNIHQVTRLQMSKPFGVIVHAEIDPDRMDEFLKMIQNNAEQSRKEPGCLRFDVLRSQDAPNQFFFYEVYKNAEAVNAHKETAHYNLWAEFKGSGGTISSTSYKVDGEFMT